MYPSFAYASLILRVPSSHLVASNTSLGAAFPFTSEVTRSVSVRFSFFAEFVRCTAFSSAGGGPAAVTPAQKVNPRAPMAHATSCAGRTGAN